MKLPARYSVTAPKPGGGMSTVSLCRDNMLDRDVIIKALSPDVDEYRLLDEIRALQQIRSGYVVQIYDVVENNGEIVAVIEEYCPGSDLSDFIGKMDKAKFYSFGYQLIFGICEIHGCGIIHRDIKPNNIRVDDELRLKIIDFGLARGMDGGAKTISEIGTAGFMAPELFKLNSKGEIEFSLEIDIFAFASAMFLLANGSLPKTARKRPPALPCAELDFTSLPFNIDPVLASLLNSCFAILPADRPSTQRLITEFRRVLLHSRHRALINIGGKANYLSDANRIVTATVVNLGSIRIEYDGDLFKLTDVTGEIYINNAKVSVGYIIPDSCVIAFGPPELKADRVYVTFDVSHPGVEF